MKHNDYLQDSKQVSLWWWYVDESIFPNNILQKALKYWLEKYAYGILQYENSSWLNDLKKEIIRWAPSFYNIPIFWNENITITNGITNALDIIWRLICKNNYNTFIIEPCYDTAIESLKRNSKSIYSIQCKWDNKGNIILTNEDFTKIETYFVNEQIKLFYTVPNYSNPTWLTISLKDRIRLWNLCKKYNVYIFEDDPYWVFSYDNQKIISFYELFPEIVLFANSFSKIWFPWLRIWFIIWNEKIIEEYVSLQKYAYSSPNLITQSIVEYLLKNNIINDIFQQRISIMREKYAIILKFFQDNVSKSQYTVINWWFYFWVNTNNSIFSELARQKWLIVVPWKIYGKNYDFSKYVRIAFSQIKKKNLQKALKTFISLF